MGKYLPTVGPAAVGRDESCPQLLCSALPPPKSSPDKRGRDRNDCGLIESTRSCSSPADTLQTRAVKSNLTWVLSVLRGAINCGAEKTRPIVHIKS